MTKERKNEIDKCADEIQKILGKYNCTIDASFIKGIYVTTIDEYEYDEDEEVYIASICDD